MQIRSSGSVKVIYLDCEKVLADVDTGILGIVDLCPEVKRVMLFGSMARGDAVPGSDVDLLIILENCDEPFWDRASRYKPEGVPIGVDVFAYTENELDQMMVDGNPFIKQALGEGIVIWERASLSSQA